MNSTFDSALMAAILTLSQGTAILLIYVANYNNLLPLLNYE